MKTAVQILSKTIFLTMAIASFWILFTDFNHAASKSVKDAAGIKPSNSDVMTKNKQLPTSIVSKPDLVVSKIQLNSDCRLQFILKNVGKGKIPNHEHKKGIVKIVIKEQAPFNIPVSKIDPRGLLKTPKGQVTYTSSMKILKPSYVNVIADPNNLIQESNDKNNSYRQTKLTPRCIEKTFKKKTGVPKPDSKMSMKAKSPESGKKPEMVTRRLDTSRLQKKKITSNTAMSSSSASTILDALGNPVNVTRPNSNDRVPPGPEINIPVRYSFSLLPEPSNVTIRLKRETGDYDIELYSGEPRSGGHFFTRPPETYDWPREPDKYYRIVVTGDDGREGQSSKFSLGIPRLSLTEPHAGRIYYTSHSKWQFSWYAEPPINVIECTLLKGGVEMYSWTPHVDPPDHLYGDEIRISPDQSWHPEGTDYKLRIRGILLVSGVRMPVAQVESEYFTIIDNWEPPPPTRSCSETIPILIQYPKQRTVWEKNKSYNLEWCVHDESVGSVNLQLINDSTEERWGIEMGATGTSTEYTVAEHLTPGLYKLYIESSDGRYSKTMYHKVDVRNWLDRPSSPAHREVWEIGETRTIVWASAGLSDQTVDISLWRPGSGERIQIADDIPNTGSFSWRILNNTIPAEDAIWENAYLQIHIGSFTQTSEYKDKNLLFPRPSMPKQRLCVNSYMDTTC